MLLDIGYVNGLTFEEREDLNKLMRVFNAHSSKNFIKDKYYDGKIPLREVNIGIAIPKELKKLEIDCRWGAKTVDMLAMRSMFDGFVGLNGEIDKNIDEIVERNNLVFEYSKACRDELKYGCTFATISQDEDDKAKIRFHTPKTASALWDGSKGRIKCGLAIIDTKYDESDDAYSPSIINYYKEDETVVISRNKGGWTAEYYPHDLGMPLMVPMIWDATTDKPFGRSRIDGPVRRLIQNYVGVMADMRIAVEFDTAPQKFLLGVTDEQFDSVISNKFKQYVGNILASTANPETGQNPEFGQLPQGNIEPHIQAIRLIATQFAAQTGLTVADVGIINDANPTSSDAILAQSQTLVALAEQLNAGNASALEQIINMSMELMGIEASSDVIPHFKNPAMPSVAVTADAAIKIASARQGFGQTDTFLEMIGFSQADIRRIKAQERDVRGQMLLQEEFKNLSDDQAGGEADGDK